MATSLLLRRSALAVARCPQGASFHRVVAIASLMATALVLSSATARGDYIYVTNSGNGTIGKYTTSGGTVNASLVSGLNQPYGIAISPSPAPKPATLTLLGSALLGFGVVRLRRRRAKA